MGVLLVMGVLSWLLRESDVGHRVQFSFTSIILLTSSVIVGPVGAGLVGAAASLLQPERVRPSVRVFNVAMISCVGSVGGLVYLAASGSRDVESLTGAVPLLLSVGLPLMVADVAQCVANAVLLAGVMRVANGVPLRGNVAKLLSTTGPAYIGYGIIGFLFVVLWIPAHVGWFSAILVLAPLFVARWAFAQYGDELRAHERTLNALVTAAEMKDAHSIGHSGRVAVLCEWIGESLNLRHNELDDVRTAGMLHDIGKLAVHSRILGARTRLEDDQLVSLAEHPRTGVAMLRGIDFLAGSLDGIAHHHERFDGLGYPDGLQGEAIPLLARIIAVADAFDALTTARAYRPAHSTGEALTVIESRGGGQFDPAVVAALTRAIGRHGWTPTVPSHLPAAQATDHDDPEASDRLAARRDLRDRIAHRREALEGQGREQVAP